jgi:hypothetical protein
MARQVSLIVVHKNMKRKIIIAFLVGGLSWLLDFAGMRLFIYFKLEYSNYYPLILYFVLPFLLGAGMIFFIKERQFYGLLYCALLVITEYVITLTEFSIISMRSPIVVLQELLFIFKINGVYSMLLAMLGGLIAVIINRIRVRQIQAS